MDIYGFTDPFFFSLVGEDGAPRSGVPGVELAAAIVTASSTPTV
jgi:hypothetical protein